MLPETIFGHKTIQSLAAVIKSLIGGWVTLDAPLTSPSWDWNSFSDVPISTQLNLSAVFGVPAGVKSVLLTAHAHDSAAWGTDGLYFACGPSTVYWFASVVRPAGGDVEASNGPVLVPCDTNGDLWYRINASGVNTMDIWLQIWGYQMP